MVKIKNNARLLSLICIIMSIGMITSCKKDNDIKSGKIELLSFGPTGSLHGDTLRFIGNNLNKVTEIDLTGATVSQSEFLRQTSEIILITVPEETEQGFVTLKTPEGDIVSKTQLNLEVPVTITEIPSKARPGEDITITGTYLNWVRQIKFGKDKVVDSFVSQSLNQLVVTVPMDAQTGSLVISTGGTEPLEIETDSVLNITLPSLSDFGPSPVEREGTLTITGTDLDLTKGILFKGVADPDTVFISKSSTELVIKVPKEANKGKIALITYSQITIESLHSLLFVGDLPDLDPLAYAFYTDELDNNWQNWGWGSTADFANTDNVRDGAASIKMDYTAEWGGLKFANSTVTTDSYTEIAFSIFGTPGTAGKKINISANDGPAYVITIEEGKWIEYKLTKADLGNPATITYLTVQNQDWTGTIYIDQVGFR